MSESLRVTLTPPALFAAAIVLAADFAELMGERPVVERKQAHWNRKGGRRSRYFGQRKARLQALWSAAMVNLERLMVLGALLGPEPQPA